MKEKKKDNTIASLFYFPFFRGDYPWCFVDKLTFIRFRTQCENRFDRYISQPWVKAGGKYRRCCLWISNIDALWSAVHGLLDESQGHTYINPDKNCNRLSFINMSTFNISMTFLLSVKICNNFFWFKLYIKSIILLLYLRLNLLSR